MAVVGGRRIEVISGGTRTPAVWLKPILSSTAVGWKGLLFEQHTSETPHVVEFPEHFATKHLLRVNTGGPSTNDWRIDGRGRRTYDRPGGVSILPAGTHVSVIASSHGRSVELVSQLTIQDHHTSMFSTARWTAPKNFCVIPIGACWRRARGRALSIRAISRRSSVVWWESLRPNSAMPGRHGVNGSSGRAMQSLKTKENASTDVYVAVNGVRIHAREQGTGEPALVFLHYWGGSLRTWTSVVDELSKEYRTVAMDHRGWGDSEAPPTGYGISDLANDAQGVVDALGLAAVRSCGTLDGRQGCPVDRLPPSEWTQGTRTGCSLATFADESVG